MIRSLRAHGLAGAVGAALLVLAFTGCAAPDGNQTGAPSPTPTSAAAEPTSEPSPAAVILTAEEAAARYLDIVCPTNAAWAAGVAAFEAKADAYFAGGDPDPTEVKSAAAVARDAGRVSALLLSDPLYVWPPTVRDSLEIIRQSYLAEIAYWDSVANSTSFDAAWNVPAPEPAPGTESAAQEVRLQLNISADTTASCVDHQDGHERLATNAP